MEVSVGSTPPQMDLKISGKLASSSGVSPHGTSSHTLMTRLLVGIASADAGGSCFIGVSSPGMEDDFFFFSPSVGVFIM